MDPSLPFSIGKSCKKTILCPENGRECDLWLTQRISAPNLMYKSLILFSYLTKKCDQFDRQLVFEALLRNSG